MPASNLNWFFTENYTLTAFSRVKSDAIGLGIMYSLEEDEDELILRFDGDIIARGSLTDCALAADKNEGSDR